MSRDAASSFLYMSMHVAIRVPQAPRLAVPTVFSLSNRSRLAVPQAPCLAQQLVSAGYHPAASVPQAPRLAHDLAEEGVRFDVRARPLVPG